MNDSGNIGRGFVPFAVYGNDELDMRHSASLFATTLSDWRNEAQVINYGAIIICRAGKACIRVNFNEWRLYEGAVITLFPNDVVQLLNDSGASGEENERFGVEMLAYNASLLREASLQLEQTVYSSLREDRCRQDTPVVTRIIDNMFRLLDVYFSQPDCTCLTRLVLLQLKAFFIGFHEYLQRNPQYRPDEVKSRRVRELFNHFMMLVERDYKVSRNVDYYSALMNISSKYLTGIVKLVTSHTPKSIVDHYAVLQLKMQLRLGERSIKEIAWDFGFTDASFFCRYFKRHTGISPQEFRELKKEKPMFLRK